MPAHTGDLLPLSGVDWTAGRESQAEYGEPDAGVLPPNDVSNYQFLVNISYTDDSVSIFSC
jgi:hypothetical protein